MSSIVFRNGPEYYKLRKILMYKPSKEVKDVNERNFKDLLFRRPPNYKLLLRQFDFFYDIMRSEGVEVILLNDLFEMVGWHPGYVPPNMMFMRDVLGVLEDLVLIGNMRHEARRLEPYIVREVFSRMGFTNLHLLDGYTFFEGGDLIHLNDNFLMVGYGPRTDFNGAYKIAEIALDKGLDVIIVSLPPFRVHLDGAMMPLERDLVIANKTSISYYPSLILYRDGEKRIDLLYNFLIDEGYEILNVSDEETREFGPNIVVIKRGRVLSYSWNREAIKMLNEYGIDVIEFNGSEYRNAGGGPHCIFNTVLRM